MFVFQECPDELLGRQRVLPGPGLPPGSGVHPGDAGLPGDGDAGVGGA